MIQHYAHTLIDAQCQTSKGLLCSHQLYMKNCLEATASLGLLSSKCSEITFGGKRPNMAKCAFNSQRRFLFQQQV